MHVYASFVWVAVNKIFILSKIYQKDVVHFEVCVPISTFPVSLSLSLFSFFAHILESALASTVFKIHSNIAIL